MLKKLILVKLGIIAFVYKITKIAIFILGMIFDLVLC
jgi:hypothetical protein